MAGLVLELQELARDSKTKVSDLLRTALVVSSKLKIDSIKSWVEDELSGYVDKDLPPYRIVPCELKSQCPYRGYMPVMILDNPSLEEVLSRTQMVKSIEELEDLFSQKGEILLISLSPTQTEILHKISSERLPLYFFVSKNEIVKIMNAVRNRILQWALELENNNVIGENMTFSGDEKLAAQTVNYVTNIGTM